MLYFSQFSTSFFGDLRRFERFALVESVSVPELLILSSCYCVRGTRRTQPLICVGWSVHYWVACAINKVFFWDFIFVHRRCRHTFASLWDTCLSFASLWRTNSWWFLCPRHSSFKGLLRSDFLRKAFIFLKVCWIFVKRTSICDCWIVHLSGVCC